MRETAKLLAADPHSVVGRFRPVGPAGFDSQGIWHGISALEFGDEKSPDDSLVLQLDRPASENEVHG